MKHIVIDLEFAEIPRFQRKINYFAKQETIEIGAVMLDDEFNVCSEFSTFVKPCYGRIDSACQHLTGICSKDLEDAPDFEGALELLRDWIDDGRFKFYAWSPNDKTQIKKECHHKQLDEKFSTIVKCHWIDLQRLFRRFSGFKQDMQLERALHALDIPTTGRLHRALDDAKNTAEILRVMSNRTESDKRFKSMHSFFDNEETHQHSTLGDIFGSLLTGLVI